MKMSVYGVLKLVPKLNISSFQLYMMIYHICYTYISSTLEDERFIYVAIKSIIYMCCMFPNKEIIL